MKRWVCGNGADRMPDISFMIMGWMFVIRDWFGSPWSLLDRFGIEKGQTVVDYGCGTGSYLRRASELVGPEGRVIAVDVHEMAAKAVTRRIERERLGNVTAVTARGNDSTLPDCTADVIYALDMFHMVSEPHAFLLELNRICRETGRLYIDNGHQSRAEARAKIESSGVWRIGEENKRYMKCVPARPE